MPRGRPKNGGVKPAKKLQGQQSVNSAVKSICDVMRRWNCAGALQYVPELTCILFLRILGERKAVEAEAVGAPFRSSLGRDPRLHRGQEQGDRRGARRPAGVALHRRATRSVVARPLGPGALERSVPAM